MKKGRRYIEPMLGTGDKKGTNIKDVKKATPKLGGSGTTWDGVSRPSNDMYRDSWDIIFRKEENEE